jgi:Type I restriction modification DNA specificity domain
VKGIFNKLLEEIRKQGGSLNIPLYIAAAEPASVKNAVNDENSIGESLAAWLKSAGEIRCEVKEILGENSVPSKLPSIAIVGKTLPTWLKRREWKRLPFGIFADSINDRVEPIDAAEEIYVGLDDLDSNSLHIRRWGKGSDVIGTKLRFRKGDIIFGRRRAYQRKLAVAEMDGICSAHAMVVRPKPSVVLQEFLPFLMTSNRFMNRAVEISVGSLSPTINWTTLKLEGFDLPPLDQQQRIAEILWAADASLEKFRELRREVETARSADLADRIRVVSRGAVRQRIEQLTFHGESGLRTGPFGSKLNADCFAPEGIPIINIAAIGDTNLKQEGLLYLKPSVADQFAPYVVRPGDLVFSRVAEIGRCMLIDEGQRGWVISSNLIRIRVDKRIISPEYMLLLLRHCTETRNQIRRLTSTGGRMLVNTKTLSEVTFAVPERIRQDEIVERAGRFDQLLRQYDEGELATAELVSRLREVFCVGVQE